MKKPKMDDTAILDHLQRLNDDASAYTWGQLGAERAKAMREYFRLPYGTEEDGWSTIVTSEVQDTVEWILPSLLKIFTSTDKAVSFEPNRQQDVDGAEQATDACNYVFYKQNPGFLLLYNSFKDALLVKSGIVTWRKDKTRTKSVQKLNGAPAEVVQMQLDEGWEVEQANPMPPQPIMNQQGQPVIDPMTGQPQMGQQLYVVKMSRIEEKPILRIDSVPPERLLIKRDWTSPLLAECPYVCHLMQVTLSELHEMGFTDVDDDDLDNSEDLRLKIEAQQRQMLTGASDIGYLNDTSMANDDDSMKVGTLYREWVLMDADGDGIAERIEILRLKDKILSQEECDHVPVAMASPILTPHSYVGMSVAETMSDLQALKTELTRQMMNSAYLANSPRTVVSTDNNWSPNANIDDLLDSRPGGIIRAKSLDAVREYITPFVGGQTLPLLEYVDSMGERRTGVSRAQQGLDANVLRNDKTAVEVQQTANAAQARVELIARVLAETFMKPMFQGLLKLLTDGEMEPIAFKLLGKFVEYDPNEWRDQYDMTINVGLGTGDRGQQAGQLQSIFNNQMMLSQSPYGSLMITPDNIYATQAKIVENAGYKNVGDFYQDPQGKPVPQQGPPPQIQIEQAKLQQKSQSDQQKMQADAEQSERQRQQDAQLEMIRAQAQQATDNNRQEMEARQHQMKLENEARLAELKAHYEDQAHMREMQFQQWKAELDAATRIEVAKLSSKNQTTDAATDAATNEISKEVTQ